MKIKKLNDFAKTPRRGSSSAAGYDMYAATSYDIVIDPHRTVLIGTGLAMEIPEGYYGGIVARSGLAVKESLRVAQGLAVIDSDYRGEVMIPIHNDSDEAKVIGAGERIAQLLILPYEVVEFEEVEELNSTERGKDGFGSTGTK